MLDYKIPDDFMDREIAETWKYLVSAAQKERDFEAALNMLKHLPAKERPRRRKPRRQAPIIADAATLFAIKTNFLWEELNEMQAVAANYRWSQSFAEKKAQLLFNVDRVQPISAHICTMYFPTP
eukprot:s687_g7.t1